MKIIKTIINNIPVTCIKTNKFKSFCGGLYFKQPFEKDKLTIKSLLRRIMIYSCKKYDTNEKLNINTLENYDAYYDASFSRYGAYVITSFRFAGVNDKFIDEEVTDNIIDTFCEIVFNPNVKDKAFDKKTFDLKFQQMKTSLENEKENPRNYCYKKLLEKMGGNLPYSYHSNLEDLAKATPELLYDEYLNLINNSEIELVLAGDFDFEKVAEKILGKLKTKVFKEPKFLENVNSNEKLKEYEEKFNTNSSIIFLGMKCFNLTPFERSYVMPIFSGILGGGASSRCFNMVREENSLAYYCYSKYEKDDGLLSVYAGIDKENYNKTKDIILEVIKGMDNIKEEELCRVKEEYIASIKENEDYNLRLLSMSYYCDFYEEGSSLERVENVKKVTLQDLFCVAKKIKVDSIYFLRGEK